jgi:hypothetical protein
VTEHLDVVAVAPTSVQLVPGAEKPPLPFDANVTAPVGWAATPAAVSVSVTVAVHVVDPPGITTAVGMHETAVELACWTARPCIPWKATRWLTGPPALDARQTPLAAPLVPTQ